MNVITILRNKRLNNVFIAREYELSNGSIPVVLVNQEFLSDLEHQLGHFSPREQRSKTTD